LTYVPIIISALSLILAVYTFLSKNSKENTTELTTVIVSLDNIKTGIADIKAELNSIKSSQKEDHDKLIRIEESLKSAWKQINKIQVGNSMNEEENI
jgi:peptidoglycan hydrolase CwlO-like protein